MNLTAGTKAEAAGRAGLWLGAGSVVVGAHILAAAWAMQRSVAALPDAPEAVYIELAPAPSAPQPVAPVLPELQSFTPPTIATPPEPQAEAAPEPVAPVLPNLVTLPTPTFPKITPQPAVAEPPPDAVLLSSDRPQRRPEIREVRRQAPQETPKAQPERQRRAEPQPERERQKAQQAAAQPTAEPQRQRRQQQSSAAQDGGEAQSRAAASPQAMANWQGQVLQRVNSHMRRAALRGQRGTLHATLVVSIAANGRASAQLAGGTGDARIDNALARQARRIPRLPAPPNGQPATVQVPIAINVR